MLDAPGGLVAGDKAAFNNLYQTYQREVRWWLGQHGIFDADAEDYAQEIWLRVWQKMHMIKSSDTVWPWLRAVVRNCVIGLKRKAGARPKFCFESVWLEEGIAQHVLPEDPMMAKERSRLVWQALEQLTYIEREALVAYYFDGLKYREMADRLDVPCGTVKSRMNSARLRFEEAVIRGHFTFNNAGR